MSLITNSNKSKAFSGEKGGTHSASVQTIIRRLRGIFGRTGRLLVNFHEAIAEARLHKAMIETDLYRNRYLHTSKNDDDLPVVR